MSWVRRVLTDTDDDGRYRSGLGIIAGASLAILPLLFGSLDAATSLTAALVGAIVIVPFWRFTGEPSRSPLAIIGYIAFFIAALIVLRQLPGLAFFVFLGGYVFTLSLLRFANGWRNPVPLSPEPAREPGPIQPFLVLVIVVPLVALLAVIVITIAVGLDTRS
jgi:hypothetical protein